MRGREVTVIKPQTYMNLSGEALEILAGMEPVRPADTLVICDDIALPLGFIRLRKKGSDGGHNGLKSVIDSLGGGSFPRLRLGVGPVPAGVDPADFVLAPLGEDELTVTAKMLREAVKCIETLIDHGVGTAMNRFNRRASEPEVEVPDEE
jgi:PTH1 family peptidyl-tRNA hydrolase